MPSGALHWCITDNLVAADLPTLDHGKAWEEFAAKHCACFRGQEERGDDTGRRHYQIYFKLRVKKSFDWIKKETGKAYLHCEVAKDPPRAWDYCGKPESRVNGGWSFQTGDRPFSQGHRNDLSGLKRAVEDGGLAGAFEADFTSAIRYSRGLQLYHQIHLGRNTRTWKTKVWVFTGPPGIGKSSFAKAIARYYGSELHVKLCSEKWFDGYDPLNHKAVLLDDFNGSIPFSQLLAIMDRGPCSVEIKGQVLPWLCEHLFITSNTALDHWYEWDKKKSKEALKRRVDVEWLGEWKTTPILIPDPPGVTIIEEVQGPKSPVILTATNLDWYGIYHENGDWDICGTISTPAEDEIVIVDE